MVVTLFFINICHYDSNITDVEPMITLEMPKESQNTNKGFFNIKVGIAGHFQASMIYG